MSSPLSFLRHHMKEFFGGLSRRESALCVLLIVILIVVNIFSSIYFINQYHYAYNNPLTSLRIDTFSPSTLPPFAVAFFQQGDTSNCGIPPQNFLNLFGQFTCDPAGTYLPSHSNTPIPQDHSECQQIPFSPPLPSTCAMPIVIQSSDNSTIKAQNDGSLYISFTNSLMHFSSDYFHNFPSNWTENPLPSFVIVGPPSVIPLIYEALKNNPYESLFENTNIGSEIPNFIDFSAVLYNWYPRNINGSYPLPPVNDMQKDSSQINSFSLTFRGIAKLNQETVYIPMLTPYAAYQWDTQHDLAFQPLFNTFNLQMLVNVQEEVVTFTLFNALSDIAAVFNISLTIFAFIFPIIIYAHSERRFIGDTKKNKKKIKEGEEEGEGEEGENDGDKEKILLKNTGGDLAERNEKNQKEKKISAKEIPHIIENENIHIVSSSPSSETSTYGAMSDEEDETN